MISLNCEFSAHVIVSITSFVCDIDDILFMISFLPLPYNIVRIINKYTLLVESDIPEPLEDGLYYVITNAEFKEPITKWIDFILEKRLQVPSGPRTNISFSNFCNNFNIPLESDLSQLKMFIAKSEYFYNININPIKIDHQGLMLWGLKVNFLELHGCRLIDITNLLTISYHIHINKNIDIDELLKIRKEIGCELCVDFAHLYARSIGKVNDYDQFREVLSHIEERLGKEALRNMHIHMSGIHHGPKGERHHLFLSDSGFNYLDVLKALKTFKSKGVVISESPNIEDDALLMQKVYQGF